jgi:hypothetical protein
MADKDDEPQLPDEPDDEADGEQSDNEEKTNASWQPHSIFEGFARQYNYLFMNLNSSLIRNLTAGFTPPNIGSWFPRIAAADFLPRLPMPTLGIDPAALNIGKGLADIVQTQYLSSLAPFTEFLEQQHKQWDSLFESFRKLAEQFFPPNWKEVDYPDLDTIEAILVDEGIPLAWVPRQDILQALLDAPDAQTRRRIISRRWKRIVSDCEAVLNEVSHPDLQCHRPFAMEIVSTLRDGHASAAQALAANLIDSILRRNFDQDDMKSVTKNKKGGKRFDLNTYRARVAFTLAPVWSAYAEYWQSQGDSIPQTFGRHPSAHAVSRRQYSRINAVIALMLVASVLGLLDWELIRTDTSDQ